MGTYVDIMLKDSVAEREAVLFIVSYKESLIVEP